VNTTRTRSRPLLALLAFASLGLVACGSDDAPDSTSVDSVESDGGETSSASGVTVSDAWSRQPAEGQTTSAVYGVVTNDTDDAITAISATSSVSDTVELHEVLMNEDDQMTMQEKEGGYEIPAGGSLTFEPGGAHIMLLDIDAATYPDAVDVTLVFDDDTSIDFTAEVRSIDEAGAMTMDDSEMDDSEMDDMDETDDSDMDHSDTEQAPSTDG
jgi:hypothetical protein